jgi:hypothetical protein
VEVVQFEVAGKAITQGSKMPFVPSYGDGTPVRRHTKSCPGSKSKNQAHHYASIPCRCPVMANVVDDNDGPLGNWRDTIGFHARVAMGDREVFDGLCRATFVFVKPRPAAHYGSGRNERILKDSAPAAPGKRPDALKLARAVEDAMTGIVYVDDSLIVTEVIAKRYCSRWETERVEVRVELLAEQTVHDLVAAGLLDLPAASGEHGHEQLSLVA